MLLCTTRLYAGRQIKLALLLFSSFCLEGSVIVIVIVGRQQQQVGDKRGAVHSRHDTPVDRLVDLRDTGARPAGWESLKTRVGVYEVSRRQADKTQGNNTTDNPIPIKSINFCFLMLQSL